MTRAGGKTDSLERDIGNVFDSFRAMRHDIFTRKDVSAVLIAMGHSSSDKSKSLVADSEVWHAIAKALPKRAIKIAGRRGYYTQIPREPPRTGPSQAAERVAPQRSTTKDARDHITWVVFELSGFGEQVARTGGLEEHLLGLFPDDSVEVFVPYLQFVHDGRSILFNSMEGYAFVSSGLVDTMYTAKVFESPYLKQVLCSNSAGSLVLHTVPDSSVEELRDRLAEMIAVEVDEDMEVEITRGICKGLTGTVVVLEEKVAHVLLTQRTLRTIRTFPRFSLLPVGDRDE